MIQKLFLPTIRLINKFIVLLSFPNFRVCQLPIGVPFSWDWFVKPFCCLNEVECVYRFCRAFLLL